MSTRISLTAAPIVVALLAVATILLALSAAPASAAPKRTLAPAAKQGRLVVFHVTKGMAKKRAIVRVGGKRIRIKRKRLVRAARTGRLVVRVSRRLAGRRARLLLSAKGSRRKRIRVSQPVASEPASQPVSTEPVSAPAEPTGTPSAPAPTAPTGGGALASVACGIGNFAVGNWPSACWRPYADDSPWNRGVGASPRLASNSDAVVSRLNGFGTPMNLLVGEPTDWEHPTYWSQPTDPVFTVRCTRSWGTCAVEGLQIRIPDAAKPANGGDAHLTVVDQASGWEYDFYDVESKPAGGGVLRIGWGGKTRIDGDGLGSDATAAKFGNLAGVIRAQEMRAGRIDHALFMTVYCDNGSYVYPAQKNGRSCASLGLPTENAPAMGQHFMLDMSVAEIDALAVPQWKKTILRAMSQYGMFVGDTGGSSWGLQFESSATYESFGIQDPLVAFARDAGAVEYNGHWVLKLRDGIDWDNRLKVVDPCVSKGTC